MKPRISETQDLCICETHYTILCVLAILAVVAILARTALQGEALEMQLRFLLFQERLHVKAEVCYIPN